jgi:molecular chaperone DnaK
VLAGDVDDVLLLDVTPLSLGIETLGGVFNKLVERNTTIPTKKTEVYSTAADNQPSVEIKVYQGEREMAADNKLLGNFHLDGIPPAPRGVPQIEVTFDIDTNGILHVSAKDLGTGKEQKITITASSGLSENEIEQMVNDAESHAQDDKERREKIEVRNQADSLIYQTEKQISENGDKLPDEIKKPVEEDIAKLKKAVEANNTDDMKSIMEQLTSKMQKFAEELYKNVGANAQGAPGGAPGAGACGPDCGDACGDTGAAGGDQKKDDDDIIDADFDMVDDDK